MRPPRGPTAFASAYSCPAEFNSPHPMQQITCDACSQATPAYDIINCGSMDNGYRQLCGRCFNAAAASLAGLKNFEHVRFEPIGMTDARGGSHDFHFRAHLFGDG